MATLSAERSHLQEAYVTLERQWETTDSLWSDDARGRFEAEMWGEYGRCVRHFLNQLDGLVDLIAQARREMR